MAREEVPFQHGTNIRHRVAVHEGQCGTTLTAAHHPGPKDAIEGVHPGNEFLDQGVTDLVD